MGDIKDKRLLFLKGGLFFALGVLAAGLILVEHPETRLALLLVIALWAFCRAYYFCFYVIQHYVDAKYRFFGLISVAKYLWQKWTQFSPIATTSHSEKNQLRGDVSCDGGTQ